MNPKAKVQEILLMSGLILSFVMSIVVFSSQRSLSVAPSQAFDANSVFNPTESVTPTASVLPTLLMSRNQDVPLKVLGSTQVATEPSYLYTELTSKGIISNVTSTSASILWLTEAPQQTLLHYGLRETQLTKIFTGLTPVYIHEAKLGNLAPNTLYYYTGHAPIVDSFTSAPVLPMIPYTQKVSGTLIGGAGTCLLRGIVTSSTDSSAYTTVITKLTTWDLPLTGLRKADYSGYYPITGSNMIEIDALCVSNGKVLYSGSTKLTFGTALRQSIDIRLHRDN